MTTKIADLLEVDLEKSDSTNTLLDSLKGDSKAAGEAILKIFQGYKGEITPAQIAEIAKEAGAEVPEAVVPEVPEAKIDDDKKPAEGEPEVTKEQKMANEAVTALRKEFEDREVKMQKELDDAKKMANDEREARLQKEYLEKAADMLVAGVSAEQMGPILKALDNGEALSKDQADVLRASFDSATAVAKENALYKSVGRGQGVTGESREAKIESEIQKISKEEKVDENKATTLLMERNPSLFG